MNSCEIKCPLCGAEADENWDWDIDDPEEDEYCVVGCTTFGCKNYHSNGKFWTSEEAWDHWQEITGG